MKKKEIKIKIKKLLLSQETLRDLKDLDTQKAMGAIGGDSVQSGFEVDCPKCPPG